MPGSKKVVKPKTKQTKTTKPTKATKPKTSKAATSAKPRQTTKKQSEKKWIVPLTCAVSLLLLGTIVVFAFANQYEKTLDTIDKTTQSTNSKSSSSGSSSSSSSTSTSTPSSSSSSSSSSSNNVKYREVLNDYEKWVNKYIDFMKKYKNASTSQQYEMLSDYSSLTAEMTEWAAKLDKVQGDLTGDDLVEYAKMYARISKRLQELY